MKTLPPPEDNLLRSAIEAIKIGVEDIAKENRARKVSAIRNFYAGTLLLGKHRLVQHAPEDNPNLLIAAKAQFSKNEEGALVQTPISNKTIGASELIERLSSLEANLDLKRLTILQRHRNEIEHFYTSASDEKLQEVFANVQLLVNDLLARIGATGILGSDWDKLVEQSDAYNERGKNSLEDLLAVSWVSEKLKEAIGEIRGAEICDCGSNHIVRSDPSITKQDAIALQCMACDSAITLRSFVEAVLDWGLPAQDRDSILMGEPSDIYECPNCEANSYITEEDNCALCGYVEDYQCCEHCGNELGIIHVSNGDIYHDDCAYRAYQISKD